MTLSRVYFGIEFVKTLQAVEAGQIKKPMDFDQTSIRKLRSFYPLTDFYYFYVKLFINMK